MIPLDRDIRHSRALVVDGNPASRGIVIAQLQDLGVGQVVQATRLAEARKRLESHRFDIVVCEQHFPGVEQSGQDLLDELRRDSLLPWSTVFVMVTGEARYEHVAEAAESALDIYLLKPYAAATLAERLRLARHRKRSLKAIFEAVEADQFERAAGLCLKRYHESGEFWLYAARIGGELLSRLHRHDTALQLYRALDASRPATWVTLGIARALSDAGQGEQALLTLQTLLAEAPECAEAHEALGHLQIGQGLMEDALASYRSASALTPGSIPRLQRLGVLAFYLDHADEAMRALDRATVLGASSKLFDPLAWLLLAFLRARKRDPRGVQRCRTALERAAGEAPDRRRLARLAAVVRVLDLDLQGRADDALAKTLALAASRRAPDFDTEAACLLLGLLSELAVNGTEDHDLDRCVDELAQRFSVSRSVEVLMSLACTRHPAYAQRVHDARVEIQRRSETAMASVLTGEPGSAVEALVELGRRTCNARVIANAHHLLQRHGPQIAEAARLESNVAELRARFDQSATVPTLGGGVRTPGSIRLRGGAVASSAGSAGTPSATRATAARAGGVRTTSPDPLAARAV